MGKHQDPIPPNPSLYPQELQLKLYQAFIFSIPILFSIILFLLFYLFYLKRRRATNNNMSSNSLPFYESTSNIQPSSFVSSNWNLGIKGELKEKLQVVQVDEELKARDLVCCVCLGEFEMKEELRQISYCGHVFHADCIRHWLRGNATCPLCRGPIIRGIKIGHSIGLGLEVAQQDNNPSAQREAQGNVNIISRLSSTIAERVIQIAE